MSLITELKRRNVIKVGMAYLVIAWLVAQVLQLVFETFGTPDWVMKTVLILLATGFPFALFFAWAFEMTPDGIKHEHEVDRTQSITPQTGKKLNHLIIGVMAVALAYFAIDKFVLDLERRPAVSEQVSPAKTDVAKSIAVLPFANMSGDAANEPFTLGIHDDLLTHLSRIKSLKTISRTSVLQYRGTTKTIPQIAEELGVNNILEGGIQRSGKQVRINLQLIDAQTDQHLWAEIYDRELTAENLFAVQGEIATEVVKSLRATLLPEEQAALEQQPTNSMAAYDLYLLGRHHWNQRTAESIELARDYFIRAIDEDQDFVQALSGLADAYTLLVSYGNMEAATAFPLAQEAIDRAMTLDNSVSEVWASQGLLLHSQNRSPEAADALERALELDQQNFSAWLWYGNSMLTMRRFEEHLAALQTAYGLEPMSLPVNVNLASAYNSRGDFVRSRQHYERVDQIDDLNPTEYKERIATTYFWSGNLAQAIAEARQVLAIDPENTDAMRRLVWTHIALGDFQKADQWIKQAATLDFLTPFAIDLFEAQGDFEGGLVYLEDKLSLLGEREDLGVIFELFRLSYLAGHVETAESYLEEYLQTRGGKPDVNPAETFQWNWLLLANFWMEHGGGDEPKHGRDLRDEITVALSSLIEQDYLHPGTYYGLAMAKAMNGDHIGALDALEESARRGFVDQARMVSEPAFRKLHANERFMTIAARLDALVETERQRLAQTQLAPYTPPTTVNPVSVPRSVLESFAGYYSDGNMVARFFLDDKGGFNVTPGQMRSFELLAISEVEFYPVLSPGLNFKFHTDDNGSVTHVMLDNNGAMSRFKLVAPPPPAIELERATLDRYQGIFAARRVTGVQDGGADSDIWTMVVSIDDQGQVWLDPDNQPRLEIFPFTETEFYMPGFDMRLRFEVNDETGIVDRMITLSNGIELEFKRQDQSP